MQGVGNVDKILVKSHDFIVGEADIHFGGCFGE